MKRDRAINRAGRRVLRHSLPVPAALRPLVLALLALLCHAPAARAADPGVFTLGTADESHGWLVVSEPGTGTPVLVHIPPRAAEPGPSGAARASSDGTIRLAMRLKQLPAAVVGVGPRAYLVFEPRGRNSQRERAVMSQDAIRARLGDTWSSDPVGRLRVHPSLPGDGTLLGLADAGFGPAALLVGVGAEPDAASDGSKGESYSLRVLAGDGWREVQLPKGFSAADRLITWRGGPALLSHDAGALVVHVGHIQPPETPQLKDAPDPSDEDAPPPPPPPPLQADWTREVWAADVLDGWFGAAGLERVVGVGPDLVAVRPTSTGFDLATLTNSRVWPLAHVDMECSEFGVAALDSTSRIIVLGVTIAADPAKENPGQTLAEVSSATGAILYSGPPRSQLPISASDFRFMVAGLLAVMVVVLVMVTRPPAAGEIVLPENTALAEPGRRFAASMADLAVAIMIGSRLADVPVSELVLPITWFTDQGLTAIGLTLAAGIVLSTIGEVMWGRSIGKFMMGCEIISSRQPPTPADAPPADPDAAVIFARPPFHLLLLRNVVKWLLPPVAAIALVDPSGRHRGDMIAGVAVIIRLEPEEEA